MNNTPNIGPYTELKPFRFWCQKVLPLVYDESLSYYELLCKVVDYLNKTMEDVDQMIIDMGDFQTAYTEFIADVDARYLAFTTAISEEMLQFKTDVNAAITSLETFVNDYFDNLDVQDEIDHKIDEMAEEGYFDTLFARVFGDNVIGTTQLYVTAWISDHLLQETGYVIDSSLSVQYAAADAKATGDAIRTIDDELTGTFYRNLFNKYLVKSGGYFGSNGTITADASSEYTDEFIPVDNTKTYKVTPTGYQLQVCTYNANKEFIERAYNSTDVTEFTFNSNVYFIKISLFTHAFPATFIFADSVTFGYLSQSEGMVLKSTSLPPFSITPEDTTFLTLKCKSVPIDDLNDAVYMANTNCYPAPGGYNMLLAEQTGYESYIITITKPTIIYVTGSIDAGNYRSISVLRQVTAITPERYEGSGGVRYRDSDNNLPTKENPLVAEAGDAVFFTTLSGFNVMTNYNENIYEFKTLEVEGEQITGLIGKRRYLKYKETGDTQNNVAYLDIFLPAKENYVLYRMAHYVNASINADSWHMYLIYACDKDFNIIDNMTTSGEMECAIALNGRPDFSGGSAHGDEIATEFTVFVDGQDVGLLDLSDFNELTEFDSLRVVEVSNLYDPNDSTTIFATHGREYIFNDEGMTINQKIDWLLNETTTTSYLAMFTPAKDITDHIYTDSDYSIYEILTDPQTGYIVPKTWNKTKKAVIYGETSGVLGVCEILDYPNYNNTTLNLRDNNGGDYNKLYFDIAGGNVSSGDTWVAKSRFNFEVTVD